MPSSLPVSPLCARPVRSRACTTAVNSSGGERQTVDAAAAAIAGCVVVVFLCAGILRATFHAPAVRLNSDLATLLWIADWSLDSTADSTSGFRLTGADNELLRVPGILGGNDPTARAITNTRRRRELTDGRSRAPRSESSQISLALPSEIIELNRVVLPKAGAQTGMLFWYDVNGRILTNSTLPRATRSGTRSRAARPCGSRDDRLALATTSSTRER